jgi:hypothetical protein
MDTKQTLEQLTALFPSSTIKWKVQEKKVEGSSTLGQVVPYLDARDYQNRLDAVLTPAGWANEMKPSSVGVVSVISILLDGHWVAKSDGAQFDGYSDGKGPRAKEMAIKGAFSDAFKRAGVMWGIGRYLYEYKAQWVELNDKDEPKVTPMLPSHMLLESERSAADTSAEQAAAEQKRAAAAEAAARDEAARTAAVSAAEQAQRDEAARVAAAEQAQREEAERVAAAEQTRRDEAARVAAAEQAQRDEAARVASAEQAQREEVARAAAEQAAKQAAAKPAANDPVVDPDEQASLARSAAIVDSAMAVGSDAGAGEAKPAAAGAKVFKGYDYSHLTLTAEEENDVVELLKKFETVKSFMVLARYVTSEKLAARLNKDARDWILAGLEKLHNKKWAEAA